MVERSRLVSTIVRTVTEYGADNLEFVSDFGLNNSAENLEIVNDFESEFWVRV